jgi:hypothetical protein
MKKIKILLNCFMLSCVGVFGTQAMELKDIIPFAETDPESKNGHYLAKVRLRVDDRMVNQTGYGLPIHVSGNVDLYDDDGFLTLAVMSRALQEYANQEAVMKKPDDVKGYLKSLVKSLNKIDRWDDVISPLLFRSIERLIIKFPTYGLATQESTESLNTLKGFLSSECDEDHSYNFFFRYFGKWVDGNKEKFNYDTTYKGKSSFRVWELGITDYWQKKIIKKPASTSTLSVFTCNFGELFTNLARRLGEIKATSLSPEDLKMVSHPEYFKGISELTNALVRLKPKENIVLSGLDIAHILTLIAQEELQGEMRQFGLDAPLPFYASIHNILNNSNMIATFRAILLPHEMAGKPLPVALQENADDLWYDLGKDSTQVAGKINKAVSDKTNGMIPTLVQPSQLNGCDFGLFATAYLKAFWLTTFKDEVRGTFTSVSGDKQETTFLKGKVEARYSYVKHDLILDLPLKNNGHYFIWMPYDLADSPLQFFRPEWMKLDESGKFDVTYPKLDITTTTNLLEGCKNIGFGSIAKPILNEFLIGHFEQKTRLKTTLEGVEAAAATAMFVYRGAGGAPRFIINQPHTVSIVQKIAEDVYLPLFTGFIASC